MSNEPVIRISMYDERDPQRDPDAIIRCVTITRNGAAGGYTCPLDEAMSLLAGEIETDPEPGESITITHCLKTQLELENMPEFDGW